MKNDVNNLDKIDVKNHNQLMAAIEPFMNDTTIRKLLVEGMEIAKRHMGFSASTEIPNDVFGGFLPAVPVQGGSYLWVDTLIGRRLDAKRVGLKIVWDLPEGHFEFDPWTKKLNKVESDNL